MGSPSPSGRIPRPPIGPDDLACLAFTSGSTGTPKGILGRHGPLSHFLPFQERRFHLGPEDRYSLLSALSHDPLQRDLFTALATGATLCVPDPAQIFAPGYLPRWLRDARVSVVHLTPAMGQLIAERPPGGEAVEIPSLRRAFLVGDVLKRRDVERLKDLAPRVRCVNLYGSTETQRAVAFHPAAEEGEAQILPLGRGMEDAQVLVVARGNGGSKADDVPRLAGIGEVGEIWMRSPHLARGYLGDERLTAERFLANPFASSPAADDRVYRTGDLGRYRADGSVVFAGRADQQIKIRGFRVEPGEIEARLGALPGVEQAVVLARATRVGETAGRRLVAWIKPAKDRGEEGASALREALQAELPVYMVPSLFLFVEDFPLTKTGKIDRRALLNRPLPEKALREAEARVAPRDKIELELAQIWEELLPASPDAKPLGVRDDFFALGGHSLLAVRMLARIEQRFSRRLPLAALFSGATIEQLATQLRDGGEGDRDGSRGDPLLVPLAGAGRMSGPGGSEPFFCVHPVYGSVLGYRGLAAGLDGRPFWGVQAAGLEDEAAPLTEVGDMAERYLAALESAQERGPYRLGGWSFGALVAFEMASRLRAAGEEVAFLGLFDPARFGDRALGSDAVGNDRVDAWIDEVLPAELDPRRRLLVAEVFRCNLGAARNYRPAAYDGTVHLFRAAERIAPPWGGEAEDPILVWRPLSADLEVEDVPGDHISMMQSPHVEVLGARLRRRLDAPHREAVP